MMEDSQFQTRYQILQEAPRYDGLNMVQDNPTVGIAPDPGLGSSGDSHASSSGPGLLLHTVPDRTRRWNHINDLDSFFKRVYRFHQSQGYHVMILHEVCDLLQYVFVILLTLYTLCGVNYDVMFGSESVHVGANHTMEVVRISLSDGLYSFSETVSHISRSVALLLVVAGVFLAARTAYAVHNIFQYWETREFFTNALKIPDHALKDVTWDEVKKQLMEVQLQQRMCVHKDILTSLDIYQRILRHQNYMIALINQNVIPVHINIPFYGEIVYLTKGYEFNLNLLLFWGSNSLLQNINIDQLRQPHKKKETIEKLEKKILQLSILNFILLPFIFVYQVLYAMYHNIERLKNEPGSLAGRCWSLYGRIYLRHYNELDHELTARLNRAYKPSVAYISSFSSPVVGEVASTMQFMAAAVAAVLICFTLHDNDFSQVDGFLSLFAVIGLIMVVSKNFLPDENLVWVPELLMNRIVAQIHYLPETWAGKQHTTQVRDEFSRLFQFKFVQIIEELISPIITPLILMFSLRQRSKKIVDFFHMFTVEVEGIGNVCSFAQMDIQQHGSPNWQPQLATRPPGRGGPGDDDVAPPRPTLGTVPDGGRTELSLMHFAFTNPDWRPPKAGAEFLTALKQRARADGGVGGLNAMPENSITHSINSLNLTAMGKIQQRWEPPMTADALHQPQSLDNNFIVRGCNGSVTRMEGPMQSSVHSGGHRSMQSSVLSHSVMPASIHPSLTGHGDRHTAFDPMLQPQTLTAYDMGISCLFLRGLSRQRRDQNQFTDAAHPINFAEQPLHHHRNYHQDLEDNTEAEIAGLQTSMANEASYGESRPYQRTPSPPPGDPFQDAMMSHLGGSVQSEALTSHYQDILHGASNLIAQQQQDRQQQQQPQQHSTAPSSSQTDQSPLLHPNKR